MLPAEYWETEGPMYGALANNVSVDGLLFFSVRDIPIGSRLNVRIFYANEYELDDIKATSETVQKHVHFADNWKGYKCALKFLEVSEEDLRKLTYLLNSNSMMDKISRMESIPLESTFPDQTKSSSSPLADPDSPAGPTAKCEFYKSGKCLKTHQCCPN